MALTGLQVENDQTLCCVCKLTEKDMMSWPPDSGYSVSPEDRNQSS